jgi:HPt (histidine-containing phosphotransfer) domain-containing protein
MESLAGAVEAEDWKGVEREAHGIKSGSRNIRADHLGTLLERMEQAGKDGRGEDVRAAFPQLTEAFQQVMDYLKEQGSSAE